jgi:hypothetical protein
MALVVGRLFGLFFALKYQWKPLSGIRNIHQLSAARMAAQADQSGGLDFSELESSASATFEGLKPKK